MNGWMDRQRDTLIDGGAYVKPGIQLTVQEILGDPKDRHRQQVGLMAHLRPWHLKAEAVWDKLIALCVLSLPSHPTWCLAVWMADVCRGGG